jgi:hypothetical protein
MSETELSKAIVDALWQVHRIEAIRVQSGRLKVARGWAHLAPAGTPDLLLAMYRQSWLEIKTCSGRLAVTQERRHNELRASGARVAVARSVRTALEIGGRWRAEDKLALRLVAEQAALEGIGLI